MRLKQWVLLGLLSTVSLGAQSEILEVYRWQATPGMANEMLTTWRAAKAIHEKAGAKVYAIQGDIGSDLNPSYLMRWNSEAEWGASKDAMAASQEWQALWAKASAEGAAKLQWSMRAVNLDPSVKANSFDDVNVFSLFIWRPAPGKTPDLIKAFAKSKQIHAALGARVEAYLESFGGVSNLHYSLSFESWSAMAAFNQKLERSEECAKFRAEIDPQNATLIDSFTASQIPL